MTILHDECKPTKPDSDAVVELILEEISPWLKNRTKSQIIAQKILSALSDAGLAVLPLKSDGGPHKMIEAGAIVAGSREFKHILNDPSGYGTYHATVMIYDAMAAAFHPSQLEKTDE